MLEHQALSRSLKAPKCKLYSAWHLQVYSKKFCISLCFAKNLLERIFQEFLIDAPGVTTHQWFSTWACILISMELWIFSCRSLISRDADLIRLECILGNDILKAPRYSNLQPICEQWRSLTWEFKQILRINLFILTIFLSLVQILSHLA